MKVVLVDPSLAGISGDMFLAALLDIGASEDKLHELAEIVERELEYCNKLEVIVRDVLKRGIKAKDVYLSIDEHVHEVPALKVAEKAINVARKAGLSDRAIKFVEKTFKEIIEAEANVHGVPVESAHLHELASTDTIFDIVGAATLIDDLGYLGDNVEKYSLPPALGGGHIEMEHGKLWVPAPATLEILRKHGVTYTSSLVKKELTTPTGASLLVSFTDYIVDFYPAMSIKKVGYGAGKKDLDKIPNILRIVEGEAYSITSDKIVEIETNIDDTPGEIMGYLVSKLLKNGALDVVILQGIGKKNRPMFVVKIISEYHNYMKLIEILMNETGTLGVRISPVSRIVAERKRKYMEVSIRGRKFNVRIKTSRIGNNILNIKPEYDDVKKLAEELNMPLRKVVNEIKKQILDKV